jgi:nucleoside-diphosphate-sugar epimerase
MKKEMILVIGALGQVGTELTVALRQHYGRNRVIAADLPETAASGPYVALNVLDKERLSAMVVQYQVTQIYHLVAVLSATGERNPQHAWHINMLGLLHVLDVAREHQLKVFWPSSIAVFGPHAPRAACYQHAVTEPTTAYGISKCAGEHWCNYYFEKYGVDVRSLRYPGLISYQGPPGGGTTDYAVEIFHQAVGYQYYQSFLSAQTTLPMMYMPDALRATIELMAAPSEKLTIRTSYNLAAMSFSPHELAQMIRHHIPAFRICYRPDARQQIADSWPTSIDDRQARYDWGWQPTYDLKRMTEDMLQTIAAKNTAAHLVIS